MTLFTLLLLPDAFTKYPQNLTKIISSTKKLWLWFWPDDAEKVHHFCKAFNFSQRNIPLTLSRNRIQVSRFTNKRPSYTTLQNCEPLFTSNLSHRNNWVCTNSNTRFRSTNTVHHIRVSHWGTLHREQPQINARRTQLYINIKSHLAGLHLHSSVKRGNGDTVPCPRTQPNNLARD